MAHRLDGSLEGSTEEIESDANKACRALFELLSALIILKDNMMKKVYAELRMVVSIDWSCLLSFKGI